jgi:hypothetical protein
MTLESKIKYTIHYEDSRNDETIARLRANLVQIVADKPHPVSVDEICEIVKIEMRIMSDLFEEELIKFLIAFDETRR